MTTFTFGGDEVASGAFDKMAACKNLVLNTDKIHTSKDSLQEYFVQKVAMIAHEEGLDLSGWEDGLMKGKQTVTPYSKYV